MPMLAEVAPAAPALAGLIEIAVLLFAFAFTWLVRVLVLAMFGWLIDILVKIPGIGGTLAHPFIVVEQAIASALGAAEHAIDSAIGASWHLLARYCEWVWREIRGNAVLLLELTTSLAPLALAIRVLQALSRHQSASGGVTAARVKTLEREYVGIEHKVRTIEKELRGIDEVGVRRQLRTLERDVARVEGQTIPAIQAADEQAASAISNLYEWAKGKASLLGVGTFALAVATALGTLGLDWIRCRNVGNAGRRLCGLGTDLLDALLLGTLAVEGSVSLVSMAHELIDLSDEIVPAVTGFVSELSSLQARTAAEQGFA